MRVMAKAVGDYGAASKEFVVGVLDSFGRGSRIIVAVVLGWWVLAAAVMLAGQVDEEGAMTARYALLIGGWTVVAGLVARFCSGRDRFVAWGMTVVGLGLGCARYWAFEQDTDAGVLGLYVLVLGTLVAVVPVRPGAAGLASVGVVGVSGGVGILVLLRVVGIEFAGVLVVLASMVPPFAAGLTGAQRYVVASILGAAGLVAAAVVAGAVWWLAGVRGGIRLTAVPWDIVWAGLADVVVGAAICRVWVFDTNALERPLNRALGDARWMSMKEAGELFPADGDVVIGERYRADLDRRGQRSFDGGNKKSWGAGGKNPTLGYALNFGSTHMLFFAGSGGFKTTSTVIPTALRYRGSMVVLDPAQEIGDQVGPVRRRLIGPSGQARNVVTFDPELESGGGCDVLVLLKSAPNKQLVVGAYATMMLTEKPKASSGADAFFEGTTHALMAGLLMFIVTTPFEKLRIGLEGSPSLRHLRRLTSLPEKELKKAIGKIVNAKGLSDWGYIEKPEDRQYVRQNLGAFVSMADQTWTGVAATVATDTRWLSTEVFANMVCKVEPAEFEVKKDEKREITEYRRAFHEKQVETLTRGMFDLRDLPFGNTDVFIQIKGEILKANSGCVRVLIGAMFKVLMDWRPDGQQAIELAKVKRPVLFCLDEVDLLGYMGALEEARDRGRKFGISLMLLYQSVGQLEKHFGKDSATAWFDSASIVSYAAVQSPETAERVSKQVGDMSVVVDGRQRSANLMDGMLGKGATISENIQKRPLLLPHEVREMSADDQVIFVRGRPPLRCGRAIFFRRPEMLRGLGASRVATGGSVKEPRGAPDAPARPAIVVAPVVASEDEDLWAAALSEEGGSASSGSVKQEVGQAGSQLERSTAVSGTGDVPAAGAPTRDQFDNGNSARVGGSAIRVSRQAVESERFALDPKEENVMSTLNGASEPELKLEAQEAIAQALADMAAGLTEGDEVESDEREEGPGFGH